MNQYRNICFFDCNTTNFTSTNNLFLSHPSIEYWRFQVVYSFATESSSSALNFLINQPPQNGSCTIYPLNGTTSTLFTISCLDWADQDGINDYSIYIWTTDRSQLLMIAFSLVANIDLRLAAGNDNTSLINLIVPVAQPGFLDQWAKFSCNGQGFSLIGQKFLAQQSTDNVEKTQKN